ncbi:hypothetical protein RFH42_16490 [Acinetobacter rudis]|uniref:hypothetical protein n=1 Tax=Acinetobacter rudis TaxID=632955 RepID=UPI00280F5050|nr:hypothetical protein [Acinetobacter rudis]MDQ8954550.1 hypothetical protein [Acinetobacter rudis]
MHIYEMIYNADPEEFHSDLYKNNNKESRKHFFNQMLDNTIKALENCKAVCEEGDIYLISMYQDEIAALKQMESAFLETGKAEISSYISMCIAERTVKDF